MPVIASYQQAVREILQVVNDAWALAAPGLPILYQNMNTQLPATSTPWARVTLTHVTGNQRTINQPTQLYTQNGTLIVQVFVPTGQGIGSTVQANLVESMLKALRGKATPGGAFFMRVHAEEIGVSDHWFQTNVSAAWQYDQRTS